MDDLEGVDVIKLLPQDEEERVEEVQESDHVGPPTDRGHAHARTT